MGARLNLHFKSLQLVNNGVTTRGVQEMVNMLQVNRVMRVVMYGSRGSTVWWLVPGPLWLSHEASCDATRTGFAQAAAQPAVQREPARGSDEATAVRRQSLSHRLGLP